MVSFTLAAQICIKSNISLLEGIHLQSLLIHHKINPLACKIKLLILPSCSYTTYTTYTTYTLDQDNIFKLISLSIPITCLLNNI